MLENLFSIFGSDFARQLAPPASKPAVGMTRNGSTAVISLSGVLSRDGRYGTSTDKVRAELSAAAADPTVSQIVLQVNSPGGMAAGSADLADTVSSVAKQKPVVAFIEDLGASAAYYAIAGATKIVAGRSALCGGVGTYATVEDASGLAGQMGVKIHVVKAGEFKGAGTFGAVVTDAQLAEIQRVINSINGQFLSAVSVGRRLTGKRLDAVSTGQVWISAEAKNLGLVDEIGSLDSILAQQQTTTSNAPLLSRQWYFEQCQKQREQFHAAQRARIPASHLSPPLKQEFPKMKNEDLSPENLAIVELFDQAVRALMATGRLSRREAVVIAARRDPKLHADYLRACNPGATIMRGS